MENASKALLMAGSVLFSVIIVGLLVLMFNGLSNVESGRTQTEEIEQASKVNETLEAYNRRLLYGTDIISICNLISDYNERYGATDNPTEGYTDITVEITIKKNIFDSDDISKFNRLGYNSISKLRLNNCNPEDIKVGIEALENCSKDLAERKVQAYDNQMYQIAFLAQKDPKGVNLLMTGDNSTDYEDYDSDGAEKLALYRKTLDYLKDFKRKLFTCAQDGDSYSDGTGVEYDPSDNGSIVAMYFTELE